MVALVLAATMAVARAADIEWDGTSYLRVPVRLGSDTRLVMPEPFDDAWEHDDEISATLLDARTLIIRPRTAKIEQRLTLPAGQSPARGAAHPSLVARTRRPAHPLLRRSIRASSWLHIEQVADIMFVYNIFIQITLENKVKRRRVSPGSGDCRIGGGGGHGGGSGSGAAIRLGYAIPLRIL